MKYLFSMVSGAVIQQLLLNLALLSIFILETIFSFSNLYGQGIRKVQKNHQCTRCFSIVSSVDVVSI